MLAPHEVPSAILSNNYTCGKCKKKSQFFESAPLDYILKEFLLLFN